MMLRLLATAHLLRCGLVPNRPRTSTWGLGTLDLEHLCANCSSHSQLGMIQSLSPHHLQCRLIGIRYKLFKSKKPLLFNYRNSTCHNEFSLELEFQSKYVLSRRPILHTHVHQALCFPQNRRDVCLDFHTRLCRKVSSNCRCLLYPT